MERVLTRGPVARGREQGRAEEGTPRERTTRCYCVVSPKSGAPCRLAGKAEGG
ncbi:hypothetical protein [Desulfonatronum lacustre]|uniref:hypothetical protein n=1 Tax=Desulfonatronum lacustre TaxID=66849 RepID=UPI0004B2880A|nr:hypothetical protein [Desulfonatronum lacustre]